MATFVAPLVISGCRDATGPVDSLAGTYVLRSLDLQPVPVLLNDGTITREYLVADTAIYNGRGTVTHTLVTRIDSVGKSYSSARTSRSQGRYTIRGDTIVFPIDCPPGANCVLPVGWRGADGNISVGFPFLAAGPKFVKRYERIR